MVQCSDCKSGIVNADQRVVLEAIHPLYREDELEYTWVLEQVNDGSYSPNSCKASSGDLSEGNLFFPQIRLKYQSEKQLDELNFPIKLTL